MNKIGQYVGYIIMLHIAVIDVCVAENFSRSDAENTVVIRHTWKALRDKNVIKQQEDMSCGAAALTTLLTYYYGEKTTEKEILDILRVRIDKATYEERLRKKRNGFSLLDLKYAAQQKGYDAAGFKLTFEQLKQLSAPVIVHVKPFGYHHFAVLRGIAGDRVYLADPSRGNIHLRAAHFIEEYGGIVFALGKSGEEYLINYPLALSRPDDYVRPDISRLIRGSTSYRDYTTNLTMRARLR